MVKFCLIDLGLFEKKIQGIGALLSRGTAYGLLISPCVDVM